jgi:hypothetical protein
MRYNGTQFEGLLAHRNFCFQKEGSCVSLEVAVGLQPAVCEGWEVISLNPPSLDDRDFHELSDQLSSPIHTATGHTGPGYGDYCSAQPTALQCDAVTFAEENNRAVASRPRERVQSPPSVYFGRSKAQGAGFRLATLVRLSLGQGASAAKMNATPSPGFRLRQLQTTTVRLLQSKERKATNLALDDGGVSWGT